MPSFDYNTAFSRNIGWLTTQEQATLRHKRVAIAGMGGVGGVHLLTLVRLGVGAFHIADFDSFELANFNRQAGATLSSIGRSKAQVMADLATDINPELDINIFPDGIHEDNLSDFFAGIDLYVDGLDFFAFSARKAIFNACAKVGIPAITAAPLGMGAALLNFLPGHMTFEEYFRWDGCSEEEMAIRFMVGLSPAMLQRNYLVDPSTVNFKAHKGPSTPMACDLCAGIAATEALKILLHRGRIIAAPRGVHVDAYHNRLVKTWRPGGNNNPLQRLAMLIAGKQLARMAASPSSSNQQKAHLSAMEQILDLGRWAPSGDNTQPWRFEIIDEHNLVVHGFDTRDHCVYDLNGRPSQISLGTLLETISIAATAHSMRTVIQRRLDHPETKPSFDVHLEPDPGIQPDSLIPYIPSRCVQRRAMHARPLTLGEKEALEASVGRDYRILWLEGFQNRFRAARLMFNYAKLRLTIPEAYEVHRTIIEWNARFSTDRVPDQALGVDQLTARLMRWVMQSWQRVEFFNAYMAGTWAPRIRMDLIPGIACAAHFAILARSRPETIDDYVSAGRAVQRYWLTASKLGLHLQPEMTPLIFARYAREGVVFTTSNVAIKQANDLSIQLNQLLGEQQSLLAVFMGRIGAGPAPVARSLRMPLNHLILKT